MLQKCFI